VRPLTEHEQVFLAELAANHTFRTIAEEYLKPQMPELIAYSTDEVSGQDNRQEWMTSSLMRDGFLMCLKLLGVANE